jgi:MFS family permease
VTRVLERLVPERLGRDFRWLLSSSWVSNLGDGIALSAGPLLVASQSHDPLVVALAALLQRLPWVLFGLLAGALADRLDRKAIVVLVDLARAAVLVVLCGSIVTGMVSVPVVLVAMFVLGTAETFADSTSSTLLPMLVQKSDLTVANARMTAGFVTVNQLVGPPVGAALFAVGAAWAFAAQAVLVAFGALLVSRIALPTRVRDVEATSHVRRDIADGVRWTWRHPAVRTLVLTILVFNVTFGAAWSVLVLYAQERLGLGDVGFGLLTTVGAVGGLLGIACYGWITRRVSLGNVMRIGLVLETLTHLGLALTTSPVIAMTIFFVFGAHAFVWATTANTVRHRAVPSELQGRVMSVGQLGSIGGIVVGSAIGGLIAQQWGVTAPFWFAFVGSGLFLLLIWGQLAHIAHEDAVEQSPSGTAA